MRGGRGRDNFEIKDFSGGLVTKSPPKNIDSKFSIDCLNVYNEGAMLRKRLGISVLNPTAATGDGNGLYNWVRGSDSTAQWLLGVWGSALYKMDVVGSAWDGTWDTLIAHSASGTAFSVSTVYFANYNGVLILATDSYDHIQRMTTSEASFFNIETGGTGTAPLAKFPFVWKNHAWFANCSGSADQLVHSAVNSYNNFTGSTYGANNILTENDIGLTGGFILNGRLYIMKAFSIHRLTYTGSPSPLVDIRQIKSTVGTRSPRTVQNVNTPEGEVVLFLGSDKKLNMCDGQDTREITDSIDIDNSAAALYMQNINAAALNNCFSIVHYDLNWYELFVCLGTTTAPTHSLVYDYRYKSLFPMSNRNFSYGAISDNGAGKKVVYVQGATNGVAYLTNSTNSDAGTAINGYWVSQKFGDPIILDRLDEVEVETDSVAVTPTFSWRADWESAWTSVTMSSGTNSHNFGLGRIDNMIQFMIQDNSTNPAFKVWGITATKRPIGVGK